jgi:hypothetical protein
LILWLVCWPIMLLSAAMAKYFFIVFLVFIFVFYCLYYLFHSNVCHLSQS